MRDNPAPYTLRRVFGVMDLRQALAVGRLRQWASARQRLKAGHRPIIEMRGRPTSKTRDVTANAAVVNVIDFERALAKLPDQLQLLLVFRYRDGQTMRQVAEALGVSQRTTFTLEAIALDKLADALDIEELL